jgi:L-gulonolactone oxidase
VTRAFRNYARTVHATPARWHAPRTDDEVATLVRRADRLRVVGAGHSFSAIAAPVDGGDAMTLAELRAYEVAADQRSVTASGGMRLRDLLAALARDGLTLPIVGSIAEQAIAGAIATGTHGSSLVHGNLASLVTGLRLVTGTGEVWDPRGDELDAARVHLGALGVVTRVTLRCEPAFRVAETIERVPIGEVAAQLPAIARSAEYAKVWWLPHTREALIYRYARTEAPASRWPSAATRRWIDQHVVHSAAFPAVVALGGARPAWVPRLNRIVSALATTRGVTAPAALALSTPMPVHHRETEAVVPLARAGDAFAATVELIAREGHMANFLVEARFVRGDSGWLSPAHGGDVCQLGAYAARLPAPLIDAYFAAFWRAMRALGARPHWGKEMDHAAAELRPLYPRFAELVALRDRLDPRRVFGNAFLERVLGP